MTRTWVYPRDSMTSAGTPPVSVQASLEVPVGSDPDIIPVGYALDAINRNRRVYVRNPDTGELHAENRLDAPRFISDIQPINQNIFIEVQARVAHDMQTREDARVFQALRDRITETPYITEEDMIEEPINVTFVGDSEMTRGIGEPIEDINAHPWFKSFWYVGDPDEKPNLGYVDSIEVISSKDIQHIVNDWLKKNPQDSLKIVLDAVKTMFTNEHMIAAQNSITYLELHNETKEEDIPTIQIELERLNNFVIRYQQSINRTLQDITTGRGQFSRARINPEDLFKELEVLNAGFGGMRWNKKESFIYIITPDIILKEPALMDHPRDINFGRMVIGLQYEKNSSRRDYQYWIFPLEPNAPINSRLRGDTIAIYFHPHVSYCGSLCTGEAGGGIGRASQECRLTDMFDLIMGVLNNYNNRSPYYNLESWNNINCSYCGRIIHSEDAILCKNCGVIVCVHCLQTCVICGVKEDVCNHSTKNSRKKYVKCSICDQRYCIKHYHSVRKHKCYKEILKQRQTVVLEFQKQIETYDLLWQEKFLKEQAKEKQRLFKIEEIRRKDRLVNEREREAILREQEKNKNIIVTSVIIPDEELDEIVQASTTGPAGWVTV